MKTGNAFAILILIATLVGIAVIDAGVEPPTDWSQSYDQRKKIPFGTYIVHEELSDILSGQRTVKDHPFSIDETIRHLDSAGVYNAGIIEIGEYSTIQEADINGLLSYVGKGGQVFLSANRIPKALRDTLDIAVSDAYEARISIGQDTIHCSLVDGLDSVKIIKNYQNSFFSHLPPTSTIHGYIHLDGHKLPNFVEVAVGEGKILLHTMPLAFTNYHMLSREGYQYVANSINAITNPSVYWVDMHFDDGRSPTPLRVILQKPGFAQAWYLLLCGLLLLLVFKSKREQRAVEVIRPEPNLSCDFARTIGALYYESGSPGNLIQKKIDYFLFDIRAMFQVDTLKLQDQKMISQLAGKSGVEKQEVEQLLTLLSKYKGAPHAPYTTDDLKNINRKIEEFKLKANML